MGNLCKISDAFLENLNFRNITNHKGDSCLHLVCKCMKNHKIEIRNWIGMQCTSHHFSIICVLIFCKIEQLSLEKYNAFWTIFENLFELSCCLLDLNCVAWIFYDSS